MKKIIAIISIVTVAFAYPMWAVADITSNQVGWYKFDEGTGTATTADSSGTGNTGTLVSSPSWVTGKIGPYALNFNGTTQSVTVNGLASSIATGDVTMCAWVNFTSNYTSASVPMIVVRSGDDPSSNDININFGQWQGGTVNDGKFYMEALQGGATTIRSAPSTNSWTAGQWYFVCGTESTTNGLKSYVNGVLDGSATTFTGRSGTASTHASIAVSPNGATTNPFAGSIDDVRVYNRELTITDIQQLYVLGQSQIATITIDSGTQTIDSGTQTIGT